MLCVRQIINERYQLQQKLGERPARQTWLARDIKTNSSVVIKFLAFGGQMQWNDLKLFEREAQILRELDHPCIPQYRDYFRIDEDTLWFAIVEQRIPGESLQNLLDKGKRFSESEVKNIALELLEILSYLHQLNPPILHRDIKPSNIILGEDKKIYLIDFGSIQDKAATQGASFTIVGTYGYTPIEQFGGRAVAASDLYALGATLIHLLTRTPPADLLQEDLQLQFQEKVEVSRDLASWLAKMSAPTLKERFHSVAQARQALKLLLDKDNSSQHQTQSEAQVERSTSVKSREFQIHQLEQEAQLWKELKEEDYLLLKKIFPKVIVNRGKDLLSELKQSFTVKNRDTDSYVKYPKQHRTNLLLVGLFSAIPLTLMMIGIFHQVYIWTTKKTVWTAKNTLQECVGKHPCQGRVEALERLSTAGEELGEYNLGSADLSDVNLRSANLGSANLWSANLWSANLESANLKFANLESANLESANLEYANLWSANLKFANLESANLYTANLKFVNLEYANLQSANLGSANLSSVNLGSANFRNAELRFANLKFANLESANLESANLKFVNLEYANLESADLKDANLRNAELRFANLENTNLTGGVPHLTKSQIKESCNWEKAIYKGNWDENNNTWIVDEAANQEYIQQLKQDKASDPETPVDCSRWE